MKGVILAGGNSKRMGRDKALIRVNNKTLIGHVYTSIKTQVNEVVISGLHDYGLGIPVINDDPKGPKGPVGALFAIWSSREEELSPGFFTVPVDAPRLPNDLCQRLYGDRSAIAVNNINTPNDLSRYLTDIAPSI